jgi:ABC-type uncharacterized transport system auxiliary subunit
MKLLAQKALLPVVAAALFLSACAPHKIQYYQLSDYPQKAAPAPPVESGFVILVGRIATPLALQDGRIRYREGANEVGAYEYHRWTDPPGIMVRDLFIEALRTSGTYKAVQDAGSTSEGDYAVRGKLLEFSELDGPAVETRVALDLELRELKTGRVVWARTLTHNDPVQAKKVADIVRSLDRGLQAVIADATQGIGAYIAAPPRTATQ